MNILVTGGAGFIGSNFVKYMLARYDYQIINLDLLTYAGNVMNIEDVLSKENFFFIQGDICNSKLVDEIFDKFEINTVINFAAESHVDRSIENPDIFLKTNILGTQVLLDAARRHWKINKTDRFSREFKTGAKFLQISTDEVYGSLGSDGLFIEETCLAPNSPYAASKASADILVRSYYHTYGIPVNITRCSNNYGPYQFPEKLIPLMINNALQNKPLPVYGDGKQIRDWLHVEDHCSAIDAVLHDGRAGEVYNIGGNNEKENIEIVKLILEKLGKSAQLITFVKDRLGHDRRYAIDNSKISKELGWSPSYTFEHGIDETILWYLKNRGWMEEILSGDYLKYYQEMYAQRSFEEYKTEH